MKKKMRALALTLVVAFSLMGAGYAAWSEKIDVKNSLATGELKVVLHNDTYQPNQGISTSQAFKFNGPADSAKDTGIATDNYVNTVTPKILNDHGVQFAFTNLYPGTKATTKYEMANVGSIPAKIAAIKVTTDAPEVLKNAVRVKYVVHSDRNAFTEITGDCTLAELQTEMNNKIAGKFVLSTYKQFQDQNKEFEADLQQFDFYIPAGNLNGDQGEKVNFNVDLQYDFVQYNQITDQPVQPK